MNKKLVIAVLAGVACLSQQRAGTDADRIRQLITTYAAVVNTGDERMLAEVWESSPDISFINPLGHAHGIDQVKAFMIGTMRDLFSQRKLVPRDINVHVYGDAAWAEFYWHFTATQRKDGVVIQSDGRETQVYHRKGDRWALVHVHYSEMPKQQ